MTRRDPHFLRSNVTQSAAFQSREVEPVFERCEFLNGRYTCGIMERATDLADGTIWREARTIFARVVECDVSSRATMLDSLCGKRAELRGLLDILVNRYENASSGMLAVLGAGGVEAERPGLTFGEILLERFRVGQELGQGGMSRVYVAEDLVLGQPVALKVLHPRLLGSELARDPFRREVARSREISHRNVCRVYDWAEVEVGGELIPFLTMEYVEAETLAAKLARDADWVKDHAGEILEQVVAGLGEIHRRGVVHLDLKPGNLFLARDAGGGMRVVIGDFGLAVLHRGTAEGGTPGYMAPEQLLGGEVSAAADVYALGLVAGELDGAPRGARRAAVQRALQAEPRLRQGSAQEFFGEWSGEQSRRHWLGGTGVIAISAGGLGVWHWRTGGGDRVRVALLPFEVSRGSMAVDVAQVAGLTEQTTQRLQSARELAVAAYTSVLVVAGKGMAAKELGRRLAADVLVQPVLTRTGNGWRVGVRLVNLVDAKAEKADALEVGPGKMAELPARVTGMVMSMLGKGEAAVRDARGVVVNEEAYALYLEGRHSWGKRLPGDLLEAVGKFERCLELAPEFGMAESGIVDCWCSLADQGEISAADKREAAMARARRGGGIGATIGGDAGELRDRPFVV